MLSKYDQPENTKKAAILLITAFLLNVVPPENEFRL